MRNPFINSAVVPTFTKTHNLGVCQIIKSIKPTTKEGRNDKSKVLSIKYKDKTWYTTIKNPQL